MLANQALARATQQLKTARIPQPQAEAEKIIAHLFQSSWSDFLLAFINKKLLPLNQKQLATLDQIIAQRCRHKPLAYLLGYQNFFGQKLLTKPGVFIPRPDSERLIEYLIKDYHQTKIKPKIIADIGTGSGTLIITLAKELNRQKTNLTFIGSDISPAAITLAKTNAQKQKIKITFVQSNLLKQLPRSLDWIIANLPYLSPQDLPKKLLQTDQVLSLTHEPKQALFTKPNALSLIQKLLLEIKKRPQLPQKLYLEFHPPHQQQLKKIIKKIFPDAQINALPDYAGKVRFLTIQF